MLQWQRFTNNRTLMFTIFAHKAALKKLEILEETQKNLIHMINRLVEENRVTQTVVDLAFRNLYALSDHKSQLRRLEEEFDDLEAIERKNFYYPPYS